MNNENAKELETFSIERSTTSDISNIGEEKMDKLLHLSFDEAQQLYGGRLEDAPACLRLKFKNTLSAMNDIQDKKPRYFVITSMGIRMYEGRNSSSRFGAVDTKIYHSLDDAKHRLDEIKAYFQFVSTELYLDLKITATNDECGGIQVDMGSSKSDYWSRAIYAIEELHE